MWRVYISEHARQRWAERGGYGDLREIDVLRRLKERLRRGARLQGRIVEVHMGDGLWARCQPADRGGWVVVTIVKRDAVPGRRRTLRRRRLQSACPGDDPGRGAASTAM